MLKMFSGFVFCFLGFFGGDGHNDSSNIDFDLNNYS